MEAIQGKTEANQQRMDDIQKEMEAGINSIWSKMEYTITRWVENILLCVNHQTHDLCD
jgi:hypothetical protein